MAQPCRWVFGCLAGSRQAGRQAAQQRQEKTSFCFLSVCLSWSDAHTHTSQNHRKPRAERAREQPQSLRAKSRVREQGAAMGQGAGGRTNDQVPPCRMAPSSSIACLELHAGSHAEHARWVPAALRVRE